MTGFARADGRNDDYDWSWELRSVNSKGLDLRLRLPPQSDALETAVRDRAAKRFKRGSISIGLTLRRAEAEQSLRVNEALLDQLLALHGTLSGKVDPAPPRLEGLLAVRGVIELQDAEADDDREALNAALLGDFEIGLDALAAARDSEGASLHTVLSGMVADIGALADAAAGIAATQPAAIKARMQAQLAELLEAAPPLAEDRLAHEVALLAGKADVREEIDRLRAHIDQATELLAAAEPVGRRLDFLCQEFNREANTICSKSADLELTRIGLALKAGVEQFREQVQNVE
jgi:uncharacterized protein (TIGR00255 family)